MKSDRGSEATLPVVIEFTSLNLLDGDFCASTSAMLEQAGVRWEIQRATSKLGNFLPRSPGLYMFVWRNQLSFLDGNDHKRDFPQILYIGKTGGDSANTIRARYAEYAKAMQSQSPARELEKNNRSSRLRKYLVLPDLEFWYATPSNESLIPEMEARLIDLLTPPLNSRRPRLKPRRRISAF